MSLEGFKDLSALAALEGGGAVSGLTRSGVALTRSGLGSPSGNLRRSSNPAFPRGFGGGALIFGAALLVLVALYYGTNINRVKLFWIAFILTRPLGATVGDYLDKPVAQGGLAFSPPSPPRSSSSS